VDVCYFIGWLRGWKVNLNILDEWLAMQGAMLGLKPRGGGERRKEGAAKKSPEGKLDWLSSASCAHREGRACLGRTHLALLWPDSLVSFFSSSDQPPCMIICVLLLVQTRTDGEVGAGSVPVLSSP